MKIDVSDIRKQIGLSREYSFEETVGIDEETLLQVHSRVTLTNTGKYILVEGILKTDLCLTCSRCLKDFTFPLNVPISEQFSDNLSCIMSKEDMEDINEFSNNVIDLYDGIRQNIILNIPIKPLCKNDCLGLCMKCGADLNDKKCQCK